MERFRADLQNHVSEPQKFADMKTDRDLLQCDIRKLKKEVDYKGTLGKLVLYEVLCYNLHIP